MNGLTGTGSLSGHMMLDLAMLPDTDADDMPDWWFDRWAMTILAGAIAELAAMPNQPYSNPDVAARQLKKYRGGLTRAKVENDRQIKDTQSAFSWD